MKPIITTCLVLCTFFFARAGKVSGLITDHKGEPLAYASVSVKNQTRGAVANSVGRYTLNLEPGTYTLICQHVGYRAESRTITVGSDAVVVNFTLEVQDLKMDEVVIKRGEDPAIQIIRETIKKRESYNREVDSFTLDVYIKGLMKLREVPDKVLGQKIEKKDLESGGLDSNGKGIIFLSESLTKVSVRQPDKYKFEVVSSRESGGGYGLSFPFFINFYQNNVAVFNNQLNPRGFVSPIADNAFHFYKFRYEGNFFENNKMIDRIRVTPKRKNEPLFNGYIQIVDGEWRIHSLELTTVKDQQLELIDTLKITQLHSQLSPDIWRTQNQVVYVAAKIFGFDITGNFLNVYSNYNLNPGFGKKHFDRVIMKYDTAFNKKDTNYWNAIRPVALEPEEKKDFKIKDSINRTWRDSMYSKRNIDSLRKARNKINPLGFFKGGVTQSFYSTRAFSTYRFEPLLTRLQYNTVEGLAIVSNQTLSVNPRKGGLNYSIGANVRYGTSNQRLNGFVAVNLRPKGENFRNRYWDISGGKRLVQFNQDNPIDPLTNSIYTLFEKRNYAKFYENWFGKIEYNTAFESGMKWKVSAVYEDRIPVQNTTDFAFFKKNRTILPNHPFELEGVPFEKHQAMVASTTVSFQPGQRYIQFPNNKVPIGSTYPTLELQYSKGLSMLGSDVNYDKWKFSVYDDMNWKLGGVFKYRFSVGGFLNRERVEIPDLQHFNGNQTFFNDKYLNSFQLAPYYRYSNAEQFYALAHVEHHLNGLLTNKIPLFNRLKWNLVLGSNAFYVNRDNYYLEAFAGLENILKIFRVDVVTAYQAQPGRTIGVRVGMGGILGSMITTNRR